MPGQDANTHIALVGCGLIGRGWLGVFARAGYLVSLFDQDPAQLDRLVSGLSATDADAVALGRIRLCTSLAEAVANADYVQESTHEDTSAKAAVFAAIDAAAPSGAILASSTSAIDIEDFAGTLPGAARCLTVHPFNPPTVLPVVEVLPTRQASPQVVERALAFLAGAGLQTVLLQRFVPGYIGNRLQAAIMREALHLVQEGVVDAAAIDNIMTGALAPRWAALGVFGTNHTNAEGGLADYYRRFWQSYSGLMETLAATPPALADSDIERLAAEVEARFGSIGVEALCAWRDAVVSRIRLVCDEARPG